MAGRLSKVPSSILGWIRLATVFAVVAPVASGAQTTSSAAQLNAQIQSIPTTRVITRPGAPPAPAGKAQTLQPGEIRIKQLPPDVEAASAALVRERLMKSSAPPSRGIGAAAASQVALFPVAGQMFAADGKTEITFRAFARVDEIMRYDGQRRLFRGSISLGVVEIVPSGATHALSVPVDFQVFGVTAKPNPVQVKTTSPPFVTVSIEIGDPGEKAVDVRVLSALSPDKEETLALGVDRPDLDVSISPQLIQGWGLETASLLVRAKQEGYAKHALQVSSRLGHFADNQLLLDNNGMATATLRSASIGRDKITVSGSPFDDATREVTYVLPVRFMVAALIGGLVGGALRLGRRIRFDGRTARDLALSVLAGAVVFGLYVLGVNLTGFKLPSQAGEVLVFVVSAIGAFVGTKVLSPAPTP